MLVRLPFRPAWLCEISSFLLRWFWKKGTTTQQCQLFDRNIPQPTDELRVRAAILAKASAGDIPRRLEWNLVTGRCRCAARTHAGPDQDPRPKKQGISHPPKASRLLGERDGSRENPHDPANISILVQINKSISRSAGSLPALLNSP